MIFPTSFPTQDLWNNSLVCPDDPSIDCKGTGLLFNRFQVRCQTLLSKITPCSRVLLEKLTVPQLVRKFPAFYKTRRFITVFTRAHHFSLSWPIAVRSAEPISLTSVLILYSDLRPRLLSDLFPKGHPKSDLLWDVSQHVKLRSYCNLAQTRVPPLFGCPRVLNVIAATHHIWRHSPSDAWGRTCPFDEGPAYRGLLPYDLNYRNLNLTKR